VASLADKCPILADFWGCNRTSGRGNVLVEVRSWHEMSRIVPECPNY
jgi:hypothetical protein